MAQYQYFVLPMVALALVIFFPLFDKNVTLSRSWRSRRRRRIVLGRIAVFALLVAPVVTYAWPLASFSGLFQSTVIAALLMLPLVAVYAWSHVRYANSPHGHSMSWQNDGDTTRKTVKKTVTKRHGVKSRDPDLV